MDHSKELKRMIIGNLVLVQLQAIVVGFLAALVSILMGWVPQGHFDVQHALVLCSSSIATASIASLGLGTSDRNPMLSVDFLTAFDTHYYLGMIMILVVILSHKCQINPDNIATPIAASLGDLTTLAILAGIGGFLFRIIGMRDRSNITSIWSDHLLDTYTWLPVLITICFLILIPIWTMICARNEYVRDVLLHGWSVRNRLSSLETCSPRSPILAAMLISR